MNSIRLKFLPKTMRYSGRVFLNAMVVTGHLLGPDGKVRRIGFAVEPRAASLTRAPFSEFSHCVFDNARKNLHIKCTCSFSKS